MRIASQGHHAAAVAARLPESTLTQMLKSALSVEVNTEVVSMRLLRCIKADRWRQRGGSMLRSTGKQTGGGFRWDKKLTVQLPAWIPAC